MFRKELIDIIFELIEDGNRGVIFSTHLTDELDRIADYILFIENGKQTLFEQKEELVIHYRLIRGTKEQMEQFHGELIGQNLRVTIPTIEDIMYYFIKGRVSESC